MPLSNKCIVAIEDTYDILTLLRMSLETLGAKFHGAATASGGMVLCETEQPDLIILDLGLPDKQGLNILPRLKRLKKEYNMPVVVVLTARDEQEIRDQAKALGADAYITKPFLMDDLIKVIHQKLQVYDEDLL